MRFSKQDKINIYQLYQQDYGYAKIKEHYPISKGEFYYLIKILAHYRLAKTRTKEKGISSKEASH